MVHIIHFVTFILAAATVVAPVAAKKSKSEVVTGTGYLDKDDRLVEADIPRMDSKGKRSKREAWLTIKGYNRNDTIGGTFNMSSLTFRSSVQVNITSKTETKITAKTLSESIVGPEGQIFELKLVRPSTDSKKKKKKFFGIEYWTREDNEMFVRFFDNAWLWVSLFFFCRVVYWKILSTRGYASDNLESDLSFSKRLPLSVSLRRWICVIGKL